ncbi:hypothetical protein QAD02_000001 [Eretmocerus hayati]|uniref:Uncharacterized protein n=1 Tax=Eretmocerus hayati TaxID=131215 RepID=A0ACC2NEQ9_9HYME|nr:hypothetical protein QAD02_000001 [Eretmocerus hayati]
MWWCPTWDIFFSIIVVESVAQILQGDTPMSCEAAGVLVEEACFIARIAVCGGVQLRIFLAEKFAQSKSGANGRLSSLRYALHVKKLPSVYLEYFTPRRWKKLASLLGSPYVVVSNLGYFFLVIVVESVAQILQGDTPMSCEAAGVLVEEACFIARIAVCGGVQLRIFLAEKFAQSKSGANGRLSSLRYALHVKKLPSVYLEYFTPRRWKKLASLLGSPYVVVSNLGYFFLVIVVESVAQILQGDTPMSCEAAGVLVEEACFIARIAVCGGVQLRIFLAEKFAQSKSGANGRLSSLRYALHVKKLPSVYLEYFTPRRWKKLASLLGSPYVVVSNLGYFFLVIVVESVAQILQGDTPMSCEAAGVLVEEACFIARIAVCGGVQLRIFLAEKFAQSKSGANGRLSSLRYALHVKELPGVYLEYFTPRRWKKLASLLGSPYVVVSNLGYFFLVIVVESVAQILQGDTPISCEAAGVLVGEACFIARIAVCGGVQLRIFLAEKFAQSKSGADGRLSSLRYALHVKKLPSVYLEYFTPRRWKKLASLLGSPYVVVSNLGYFFLVIVVESVAQILQGDTPMSCEAAGVLVEEACFIARIAVCGGVQLRMFLAEKFAESKSGANGRLSSLRCALHVRKLPSVYLEYFTPRRWKKLASLLGSPYVVVSNLGYFFLVIVVESVAQILQGDTPISCEAAGVLVEEACFIARIAVCGGVQLRIFLAEKFAQSKSGANGRLSSLRYALHVKKLPSVYLEYFTPRRWKKLASLLGSPYVVVSNLGYFFLVIVVESVAQILQGDTPMSCEAAGVLVEEACFIARIAVCGGVQLRIFLAEKFAESKSGANGRLSSLRYALHVKKLPSVYLEYFTPRRWKKLASLLGSPYVVVSNLGYFFLVIVVESVAQILQGDTPMSCEAAGVLVEEACFIARIAVCGGVQLRIFLAEKFAQSKSGANGRLSSLRYALHVKKLPSVYLEYFTPRRWKKLASLLGSPYVVVSNLGYFFLVIVVESVAQILQGDTPMSCEAAGVLVEEACFIARIAVCGGVQLGIFFLVIVVESVAQILQGDTPMSCEAAGVLVSGLPEKPPNIPWG